jgi:hypothetical protein
VGVKEGDLAAGLRRVARQLVRQRRGLGVLDDPGAASLALALAVSSLVREIAAWQKDRGRAHQASAARDSAAMISSWVAERTVDGLRPSTSLDHGVAARGPQREPHPDHVGPRFGAGVVATGR